MSTTAIRERPIICSGPMVRAILDGSKTQTRRVVKPELKWKHYDICRPDMMAAPNAVWWHSAETDRVGVNQECPYGAVGQRLWVRETVDILDGRPDVVLNDVAPAPEADWPALVSYRATNSNEKISVAREHWRVGYDSDQVRWRPSIHMPRWASRITLEITDVRVERLQSISEEDARQEGVFSWRTGLNEAERATLFVRGTEARCACGDDSSVAQRLFYILWDSINAKRASWDSNCFVWALTFKRIEQPAQEQAA